MNNEWQAGLIDGMSGAKRGRSDTPINDRQNPVLAVSQLFLKGVNMIDLFFTLLLGRYLTKFEMFAENFIDNRLSEIPQNKNKSNRI